MGARVLWVSGFAWLGLLLEAQVGLGQIQGDGSLGTLVNGDFTAPCFGSCLITGGANPQNGPNLFHSFFRFSLPNGDLAGFLVNPSVQNVLVRVTGVGNDFASILNGQIQTNQPVNFFLLNPNGILFGPRAQIVNGGAFIATTAERIQFQDGRVFAAQDSNPVLTISTPTGLQVGEQPKPIGLVGSQLRSGINSLFSNLTLVGGDVAFNGAAAVIPGGRIDIASMAGPGTVLPQANGSLAVPDGVARGSVVLDGSILGVPGSGGGGISITAQNIGVGGRSLVIGGIFTGLGTPNSQAGSVQIDATETFLATGNSGIANDINTGSLGRGGDIVISARDVVVTDGARLSASVFGTGEAGDVKITASDRIFLRGKETIIFTDITPEGKGQGGNIALDAPTIEVIDGAQFVASTSGIGDAGNVLITASDRVYFSGSGQFASSVVSNVKETATGNGGDVVIDTGVLEVRDGAQFTAETLGKGDAGNIRITAIEKVLFQGRSPNGQFNSAAFAGVGATGEGKGGDVLIESPVIEVRDGGLLRAATLNKGDAGDIRIIASNRALFEARSAAFSGVGTEGKGQGGNVVIEAPVLEVLSGSQIVASTLGRGDAGNVRVASNRVILQNEGNIFSAVSVGGQGKGGDVVIDSTFLEVRNGSQIRADSIRGQGDAGNVRVTASNSILLDAADPLTGLANGILTFNGVTGQGGDIGISTPTLTVSNGSVIDSRTLSAEPGGNIILNVDELSLLSGGQIIASSEASGSAGSITVNAAESIRIAGDDPTFTVRAGLIPGFNVFNFPQSTISVQSRNTGTAGNLILNTPILTLADGGQLIADSNAVTGGNITLNLNESLLMRNGSLISATAGRAQGAGDGGNITINSPFVLAIPQENNDIIANAFSGTGGNIIINAQGILNFTLNENGKPFEQLRSQATNDISASSQFGTQGVLNLAGLNVDPSRGSVQLPIGLIDNSNRIDNPCGSSSKTSQGSFVITGRGGLAADPSSLRYAPISDWVSLDRSAQLMTTLSAQPASPRLEQPIEANDWHQNAQGKIQIIAGQAIIHPSPVCLDKIIQQTAP
jgi:filamentous hemagglutinin family protein